MTFTVEIMCEKAYSQYNHEGRRGYLRKVTKPVLKIEPEACAKWFKMNHKSFFTKRFILVCKTRADALVLVRHFKACPAFSNIGVKYVDVQTAKEAASEKRVSRKKALVAVPF